MREGTPGVLAVTRPIFRVAAFTASRAHQQGVRWVAAFSGDHGRPNIC